MSFESFLIVQSFFFHHPISNFVNVKVVKYKSFKCKKSFRLCWWIIQLVSGKDFCKYFKLLWDHEFELSWLWNGCFWRRQRIHISISLKVILVFLVNAFNVSSCLNFEFKYYLLQSVIVISVVTKSQVVLTQSALKSFSHPSLILQSLRNFNQT